MVEANVSSTDTKEQSLKLHQPSLSIPVWMGDKWSGSFLSAYRNQRPMEAQKILPKEIHLKADGKNLLHMWVWVLFYFFFFFSSSLRQLLMQFMARTFMSTQERAVLSDMFISLLPL